MKKFKTNQKGNVLFLILIAVALFAALSYAVTQSSRSGGDASRETNILNAAQLTQYPVTVRTAALRMIIDGYQDTQIAFTKPYNTATVSDPLLVFNPLGGGAIYQNAPSEVMDNGSAGEWFFNMNYEIPQIGSSVASSTLGNELIAFLPGVSESVCKRLNQEAGILTDPRQDNPVATADLSGGTGADTGDYDFDIDTPSTDIPSSETVLQTGAYTGSGGVSSYSANITDGKPFGCFRNGGTAPDNAFVFYTVILER